VTYDVMFLAAVWSRLCYSVAYVCRLSVCLYRMYCG